MQDRYTGDVGDFSKFALLRALAPDRRVGICWYRTDGALERNFDGKHITYLRRPLEYEHLEPAVFSAMSRIIERPPAGMTRSIAQLQDANLLDGAIYHDSLVPAVKSDRAQWKVEMCEKVRECNFVFLDPDNGLTETSYSIKHVRLDELTVLRTGNRPLLLYCHQDRTAGGKSAFVRKLRKMLKSIGINESIAIRLSPGTSRFYFLIDYDDVLHERAKQFVNRWLDKAELL